MPENPPKTWLTYHLAHPGPGNAFPGDPNPAFFWKGRYHLHYIYRNHSGFVFAHVSSKDMVHWEWHPTVLGPKTMGHGMFSGTGFITKDGRPSIVYHGQGSKRNWIAYAIGRQPGPMEQAPSNDATRQGWESNDEYALLRSRYLDQRWHLLWSQRHAAARNPQ